jgi:ATP-dependent DNA helicase RecQ
MKDQVNALTQSGIKAAFINLSLNERQVYKALNNAVNGLYKLIYVAPERLLTPDFMAFARSAEISMLTVDEAHCISQWGQDFRPSYAKIPEFVAQLKTRPVVSAFTATATPIVREDIINQLILNNPTVLIAGFDRQNLYFEVKKPNKKFSALTDFLKNKKDRSGIVYCSTRAKVEEVCASLQQSGFNASRYHAGLSDIERHSNQDDFLYDRVQIMVATNAFGMGIDKSNVSFVVHYNMPLNMEGYYQEAGRAGRDGMPADCILLYSGQDVRTNLWLIDHARDVEYPDAETENMLKERDRERLREMTFYCSTSDCLRNYILKYFGETPPHYCGNCGNCNTNFETADITVDVQKIISCVARLKERYGVNMIIDVLRGSRNEKVLRFEFDKLSVYGISEKNDKQLREIINHMILSDYLIKTDDEYPLIKLGPRANEVLHDSASVHMKLSKEKEKTVPKVKEQPAANSVDMQLLTRLKELRIIIAKENNVPAFVIFPDSSLNDMCTRLPKTPEEFLRVSGVGRAKLEMFGERFLKAIAEFLNESDTEPPPDKPSKKGFDASEVEISEEAVSVNVIADRINFGLTGIGNDKISGQKINNWLMSVGYITTIEENNKSYKMPTDKGAELGIISEEHFLLGKTIKVNLLTSAAQKYVVLNTLEIIKL